LPTTPLRAAGGDGRRGVTRRALHTQHPGRGEHLAVTRRRRFELRRVRSHVACAGRDYATLPVPGQILIVGSHCAAVLLSLQAMFPQLVVLW
jgi:hypothetical protein